MIYKKRELNLINIDDFFVELKFEIATARADGCEILRIDINDNTENEDTSKSHSQIKKILRSMKQKNFIQFFANPSDFENHTTEAVFLLNKYSMFVDSEEKNANFIYIKL